MPDYEEEDFAKDHYSFEDEHEADPNAKKEYGLEDEYEDDVGYSGEEDNDE